MAEGTKLLLKWALLHFEVLYLWPDGSDVKCWLGLAIVSARRYWVREGRWLHNIVKNRSGRWRGVGVQQDGLDYAFVKTTTVDGGKRHWSKFTDNMESLLGSFMHTSDVLIKTQFTVYDESKIFEAAHLFNYLAMDGGGFSPVWGVFFLFCPRSAAGNYYVLMVV